MVRSSALGRLIDARLPLIVVLWFTACAAMCQEVPAGGVAVGPFFAYPSLDLGLKHDDNVLLQNTNRINSLVEVISPALKLDAKHQGNLYTLNYRGEAAHYSSASAVDYTDHQLFATAAQTFTTRTSLRLRGELLYSHDAPGTTNIQAVGEPNKWRATSASGVFGYGSQGAQGRIEIEGAYYDKSYLNNLQNTYLYEYTKSDLGGTFYYRVMPLTRLLFQLKETKIDYKASTSTQSSTEQRLLVGVTWEATAKTSGTAKIGYLRKDFDSPQRQDYSGLSWELGARWSPLTYSSFDLASSQKALESTGVGDYILESNINTVWSHTWSTQVTTFVSAGYTRDEYVNSTPVRTDDIYNYGAKVRYEMRRWLKWDLEYSHTTRDSTVPTAVYDRNLIMLTLRATL